MKKTFISIVFAAFLSTLFAQPTLKEWEPFNKENKKILFNSFIDSDDNSFYVEIRNKEEKKYFLEKRKKETGELVYQKELDSESCFSFCFNKYIIVIYNVLDKPSDVRTLSCSLFSSENGVKIKDVKLTEMKAQLELGNHSFEYGFSLSPDKSKLLVVPHHTWYVNEVNNLKLFDVSNMSLLWEKNYDTKQIVTNRYEVNNDGDVVFANNQTIGVIKNKSKEINLIKLQLPDDVYPKEIKLKFLSKGNVIAACVYKKSNDNGISGGVLFSQLNIVDLKVVSQSVKDFDKLAEEKLTWEDNIDVRKFSGEKKFENIDIIESEGDVYFIAEHSMKYLGDGRRLSYSHGDLVVSRFSSAGVVEWTKILPRESWTSQLYCNVVASNKKINIIYAEHPANEKYTVENYKQGKLKPALNNRGSNIISVTINDSGNAIKSVIVKEKDLSVFPQQKNILLEKNVLLIYMDKSHLGNYGTLTY